MRFGLDVSQHQLTWDELHGRVGFAERTGFDGAWVFDHFQALYGDPTGPCLEGWSLMAALAASTDRIRLGTLVTGVTYRHPAILAAQAITVDVISAGRLEFAIGAAWFEGEHRALGVDFPPVPERARLLEDTARIFRLLCTTDGATYDGTVVSLRDASYHPRPVQRPHPPVWIGASGPRRTLPIVGREADAWHTFGSLDRWIGMWDVVRRSAEDAGRDPETITRAIDLSLSQPMDDVRRRIDGAIERGISYLTVSWPSEGKSRLDEFVDHVMPGYLDQG